MKVTIVLTVLLSLIASTTLANELGSIPIEDQGPGKGGKKGKKEKK